MRPSGARSCPGLVAIRKPIASCPAGSPIGFPQRRHFRVEAGFVEPERRQLPGDRTIKSGRGRQPCRAQCGRAFPVGLARTMDRLLQRGHLGRPGIQRGQPHAQRIKQRRQLGHRDGCFVPPRAMRTTALRPARAREDRHRRRPPSWRQQAFRFSQRLLGSLQCNQCRCGRIGSVRLVWRNQPLQATRSGAQRRTRDPDCAGRAEQVRQVLPRLPQPAARLAAAAAAHSPAALPRPPEGRARLIHPPRGEAIPHRAPPSAIALRAASSAASALAPLAPCHHGRFAQCPRHAERIEQCGVARGICQANLLMLALHFHQQRPGTPQQARHRPAGR